MPRILGMNSLNMFVALEKLRMINVNTAEMSKNYNMTDEVKISTVMIGTEVQNLVTSNINNHTEGVHPPSAGQKPFTVRAGYVEDENKNTCAAYIKELTEYIYSTTNRPVEPNKNRSISSDPEYLKIYNFLVNFLKKIREKQNWPNRSEISPDEVIALDKFTNAYVKKYGDFFNCTPLEDEISDADMGLDFSKLDSNEFLGQLLIDVENRRVFFEQNFQKKKRNDKMVYASFISGRPVIFESVKMGDDGKIDYWRMYDIYRHIKNMLDYSDDPRYAPVTGVIFRAANSKADAIPPPSYRHYAPIEGGYLFYRT